jgi:hypothetical protein
VPPFPHLKWSRGSLGARYGRAGRRMQLNHEVATKRRKPFPVRRTESLPARAPHPGVARRAHGAVRLDETRRGVKGDAAALALGPVGVARSTGTPSTYLLRIVPPDPSGRVAPCSARFGSWPTSDTVRRRRPDCYVPPRRNVHPRHHPGASLSAATHRPKVQAAWFSAAFFPPVPRPTPHNGEVVQNLLHVRRR